MPDDAVSYALVERFFTDDGELNGVDPATAFCLGVEFAMVREDVIDNEDAFSAMVNPLNAERVLKMCWNHRRVAERVPVEGYKDWVEIKVKAKT